MAAQTKIIRIARPFTKGWVTDRPRWALDQQEMADGQDVFWPRGVAVSRRAWNYTQTQDPLGTSGTLGGVMAVQLSPQSNDVTYVVTDDAGRVGIANTGSAQTAFVGLFVTTYLPRAYFDGEVLLCPQDGVSPILRWSGLNGSLAQITNIELDSLAVSFTSLSGFGVPSPSPSFAPGSSVSGSIAIARNAKTITGTNTFFQTDMPRNAYLDLRYVGNFGFTQRIESVSSNTSASVKTPPFVLSSASSPVTITGTTIGVSPFGVIGLRAVVTEMGTATISGTTLTGQATRWNASGPGYAPVFGGDVVARLAQPAAGSTAAVTSTPNAGLITAVANDTSATLFATPSVTYTAEPYAILRSMPGREACAHQGRLWFTGIDWDPNRIYVSPPSTSDYNLGQLFNGEDAPEIDYANAAQAKYVDVPDRFSDGRIVSLLSGRNALLVLRSNNCYGIFGAWPGITVEKLADDAGCVDIRAAVSGEGQMYWAGEEGIYRYVPGRGVQDISAEKVSREWRRIMRERSTSAIISMGVVNRHIVISYLDGQTYGLGSGSQEPVTWLYDTTTDTWCGKVSGVRARYMNTANLRGQSDDLFFIEGAPSNRRIGSLAAAFTDDDSAPQTGGNGPDFYAETGSIVTGQATDSFRVTEMRVGYECGGNINPTLIVKTGTGDSSPTVTQATLPETTDITTQRIRGATTNSTQAGIGKQTRQFSARVEQGSTAPQTAKVHEIQVVAREFSNRD